MYGMRNENDRSTGVLWHARNMEKRNNIVRGPKVIEQHMWDREELYCVGEMMRIKTTKHKRHLNVPQADLKARCIPYNTDVEIICANDEYGYTALRKIRSKTYGTGRKVPFPSTKVFKNHELSPMRLFQDTIVNSVDVEPLAAEDASDQNVVLDDAVNKVTHFMIAWMKRAMLYTRGGRMVLQKSLIQSWE